jgi:hypothetical protein
MLAGHAIGAHLFDYLDRELDPREAAVVELYGFLLLLAGTGWDVVRRRRHEASVLGFK